MKKIPALLCLLFCLSSLLSNAQHTHEWYGSLEATSPFKVIDAKSYPRGKEYRRTKAGFSFGYRTFTYPNERRFNFHYGLESLYRTFDDYYTSDFSINGNSNLVQQTYKSLHLLVVAGSTFKPSESGKVPRIGLRAGFGPALIDRRIERIENFAVIYERKLMLTPNRFSVTASADWSLTKAWYLGLISTFLSKDLSSPNVNYLNSLSVGIFTSLNL